MALPVLSVVSWAFSLLVTLIGIFTLTRGVTSLVRQARGDTPEPGCMHPVGKRTRMLFTIALSYREFKGRPWVRLAHWFVMISFPLLFFAPITDYGQLCSQHFTLPLIGHFVPQEWLMEFFAWGGLFGIIALMIIRARSGRSPATEVALLNDELDQAVASLGACKGKLPSDLSRPYPRDGSPKGTASRFLGPARWQALFVEWVMLIVCTCIIALRGLGFALESVTPGAALGVGLARHFPLTSWIGTLLIGAGANAMGTANGVILVTTLKIITSMLWMIVVDIQTSMGIAWHRFLAVINVYARRKVDRNKSLGVADHMLISGKSVTSPDAFDDLDEDTVLGTSSLAELSWKARLDLYACTEYGRCQELCPARNTVKPPSSKLLIMSMHGHMESTSKKEIVSQQISDAQAFGEQSAKGFAASGGIMLDKGVDSNPHFLDLPKVLAASGTTGPVGVADVDAPLVPEVVPEEALWDCTMRGVCVGQCLVDVEHINHILDLRRRQVPMESAFPCELSRAFRGMELEQNPYNQPARKRLDWAKDLDFDVPVVGEDLEDASEADYLFWTGCTGAFDDSAKETSAAIAELLHTAGVSFAVLGSGESCAGDPARRIENEASFWILAAQVTETLNEAEPQEIIASHAHCFNTIAGEFPELGGHSEVVHHTQLLNRSVREGRLTPAAAPDVAKCSAAASATANRGAITPVAAEPGEQDKAFGTPLHVIYYDACYLGRHNRIFASPRKLLASLSGVELVEMPRHTNHVMCCGVGGAYAWFKESCGTRIVDARIAEAASVGADVIAIACPFCSQMLGSASGASVGLFPTLAPASSASAGVGDSDSTDVALGAGIDKLGGARVGVPTDVGTSAGFPAGADASASAGASAGADMGMSAAMGADAGAQRISFVKDVAIVPLEFVRRGQAQLPVEGE